MLYLLIQYLRVNFQFFFKYKRTLHNFIFYNIERSLLILFTFTDKDSIAPS